MKSSNINNSILVFMTLQIDETKVMAITGINIGNNNHYYGSSKNL